MRLQAAKSAAFQGFLDAAAIAAILLLLSICMAAL